jgi:DNA polymerase-3 subunit chi
MTTRVDYYLLDRAEPQAVAYYTCRLLNKACQAGLRIFLLTDSSDQSQLMDGLLWTSSDANFIPHALIDSAEAADPLTKICIGHELGTAQGVDQQPNFDMLVNMQAVEACQGEHFKRVAELVPADEAHKNAARKRYAAWRDVGAEQTLHNIKIN